MALLRAGDDKNLPSILRTSRKLRECPGFQKIFGPEFRVVDTLGDGSCMFHALANALCPSYDWIKDRRTKTAVGLRLRDSILKYSNQSLYDAAMEQLRQRHARLARDPNVSAPPLPHIPPYRTFREKMSNTHEWAEITMISFCAFCFGFNLMFFSDVECNFYFGVDRLDAVEQLPTIFICWSQHSHFELICRVNDDGSVDRQFFWQKDRALLDRVAKAYNEAGHA